MVHGPRKWFDDERVGHADEPVDDERVGHDAEPVAQGLHLLVLCLNLVFFVPNECFL